MKIDRRHFLEAGALSMAAVSVSELFASGQPKESAIDAHVHVWTPDVKRYPLAEGYSIADMQPPSFTPEELLAIARPAGVGRVVLIQMSFYGFDNRYMLDAIREHPGVFRGVAIIDEHEPNVVARMRKLKEQGVRGFRLYGWKPPYETWLASEGMARMWKAGAELGMAMCGLVNPEALGPLDAMCEKYPETPVVIDHFGRVGVDGEIRKADLDMLCRIARHKNANVKVSAYYALGKKVAPYTDLGPMIKRLVDAYSPQRLMWASDCPYQVQNGHKYVDSIELIRSKLDFLSESDRAWILRRTAERVYFS
jgi:predicted TIM-barrel fold metal-dependent hydrolase